MIKKKDGKEHEVQEGWVGYVLPFDLVQQRLLSKELEALKAKERELAEASAEIESLMESLSEEDKDYLLNDNNDAFVVAQVTKAIKQAYADVETPETITLGDYLEFIGAKPAPNKAAKVKFVEDHPEVNWSSIEANKDGTYGVGKINAYLKSLQSSITFDENTLEATLVNVDELLTLEKELKAQINEDAKTLHLLTKTTIEALEEAQVKALLEAKWVEPIVSAILALPNEVIEHLTDTVQALADKYAVTYTETTQKLTEAEHSLADLIGDLTGDEFDLKGLAQFQALLKGV